MFYVEEDVLFAVQEAIKVFGPVGAMNQDARLKNYTVFSRKFGKIWYGDIALTHRDATTKLIDLSQRLGEQLWLNAQDEHGWT